MIPHKSFKTSVEEMKRLAKMLIPYTFPIVSIDDEREIVFLKQRQLTIDGYELSVIFSKAQYPENSEIESLQISAVNAPFVSFNVICKVARSFLGEEHLGFAEFFKMDKKIYCWTLRYQDGIKIPATNRSTDTVFEDFQYSSLPTGCGNLYDS